jgi:hypothetical protein
MTNCSFGQSHSTGYTSTWFPRQPHPVWRARSGAQAGALRAEFRDSDHMYDRDYADRLDVLRLQLSDLSGL